MSSQPSGDQALRFLVFGAGAIGTYIGGSLALLGHPVVFLERPEVAEQVRQRGMRLTIKDKDHVIPDPRVAQSLEEALEQGPYDAAIFALKSFDTLPALESLKPHRDRLPVLLSLQNGVENEPVLEAVLGKGRVIAGTVTSAISRRAAGDVQLERPRGMGVAAGNPLSMDLVLVFNRAGLNARLYRHASDMKWSKMITNLVANATSAILDMTPAQIFEHPALFRIEIQQLRETLKVMDAEHIQVVDLPGTPVRALTFAVRNLPLALSRNLLKNAVGSGRGGKMPSFHIDLYGGRGKTEVDFLNGAVARHGQMLSIPTPVNRTLSEILQGISSGQIPLLDYRNQPARLAAEIEKAAK